MRKKMDYSANSAESKKPNFNISKNILDVKLYRDPDSQYIFIGFDLISPSCQNFSKLPLNLQQHITITPDLEERILKKIWEEATEEEKTFLSSDYVSDVVFDQKSKWNIHKSSIYYQLPTNPAAALNWLGAFVIYLNQDTKNFCTHFKDYTKDSSDNFYQGVTKLECIEKYQTENDVNSTIHKILIEAILSLKNENSSDCYASTMTAIETIYKKYCDDRAKSININFIAYINPVSYVQIKNQQAIKELLTTVIDKPAHDGGRYNWRYTEINFLLSANFSMTHDDKLSIVALDKNPSYEIHYAPGKRNEHIFEPELFFVAKKLGLEFEKDNFKENGIIFNAESTNKLLKYGMVCIEKTTQAVKNEMYAQNWGSFFNVSSVNKPNLSFNILDCSEKIYEVKYNSPISKELPEEIQKQLSKIKLCIQMVQNKNGIDSVTGKLDLNTNEVTLVLFNGRNGTDTDIVDEENKNVIELLRTFDAKIAKVPYQHSYWSQSLVTLPYQKMENVIESLRLLEDIPIESKMVARC